MFERAENSGQLSYLRRLILPSSSLNSPVSRRLHGSTDELISSFALSPNEETLLVGTNHNHLYEIAFSKMVTDLLCQSIVIREFSAGLHEERNQFVHCGDRWCTSRSDSHWCRFTSQAYALHHRNGSFIEGLESTIEVNQRRSEGKRTYVRWLSHAEFSEKFSEQPLTISVHPMGIFLAISFANALRIHLYTIDGLTLFHQFDLFNIRSVSMLRRFNNLACLRSRWNTVTRAISWLLYRRIRFISPIMLIINRHWCPFDQRGKQWDEKSRRRRSTIVVSIASLEWWWCICSDHWLWWIDRSMGYLHRSMFISSEADRSLSLVHLVGLVPVSNRRFHRGRHVHRQREQTGVSSL